ncbi:MAG: flagellar hook-length control protein FliK [Gammaproteobacteria bacterium]
MEIKLPIDAQSQMTLVRMKDTPLALKVGQIVEVNVVLQNRLDTQSITLELADKTLQLQSNQPLAVASGEKLKLEVIRLIPSLEFKVVTTPKDASANQAPSSIQIQKQTGPIILKIPPPLADHKSAIGAALPPGQPPLVAIKETLTANVLAVTENQVRLQLPGQSQIQLTLDGAAAASLRPGQQVLLEPVRMGDGPALQLKIPDTTVKITELIKQNLPIHESPVFFIDQLIDNLSTLQKAESVSDTLKRLAREIIQNLPRRQQLTEAAFLKRAADQSGVFLEAQLAVSEKSQTLQPVNDFKAQLLKFIESLKHQINADPPSETKSTPADLEQLKTLLQKTENSVAKIILDQLASLPRDESTQQFWQMEIPFLDDGTAESIHIEIERDSAPKESPDAPIWSVTIKLSPSNMGTLHCKLSYLDGAINTHFWSQQTPVTELIKQNLDVLRDRLEHSGLKAGRMDALEGEPNPTKCQGQPKEKLLDEKA